MLSPLLCLAFWLHASTAAPTDDSGHPTVTIDNGIVVGTATSLPKRPHGYDSVHAYLGIPFAQSPPLRFAPPEPAPAWLTPLNATVFKPACIQQYSGSAGEEIHENVKKIFGTYGGPELEESEDCLYLNIFTPPVVSKTHLKPVMFWIFGGNLQFGSASLDRYDGGSLAANNDVIVVTINYRLNIFGFSNAPELPRGAQNAGFLDQRMALQWVQENIAAFGGDPKRVMLFGESAGGYSVKQLLANPPRPLPFAAAIMQSQQSGHTADSKRSWERVANHFGCRERISQLRCLREVPTAKLKNFIEKSYVGFGPASEDGTSTMDVRKAINSGTLAKVPIMIGTNANEARAFEAFIGLERTADIFELVSKFFTLKNSTQVKELDIMLEQTKDQKAYHGLDRFFTDFAFTCPSGVLAQHLAFKGYDVWRYHFAGVYPNMAIFGEHPEQGAYHTAEIPMIFGTSGANSTDRQIELSQIMQGIWSSMAAKPELGPGWPKVSEKVLGEMGNEKWKAPVRTVDTLEIDKDCWRLLGLAEQFGLAW